MNFSPDPFSEGLSFEDHLPCAIESRVEPPSLAERVRLNDRNFSLLKTHALEDYQRRDIDYELEGIASEIERIDQKMNLMTELLCDLLSAEAQIPAPRALAISMAGLQLRPAAGETYRRGRLGHPKSVFNPRRAAAFEIVGKGCADAGQCTGGA